VLINDLAARMRAHRAAIQAAIAGVVDSGWFVLGSRVREFEQAFAAYLGAGFCVGVGNGTDAIELALRALGVGAGDRVAPRQSGPPPRMRSTRLVVEHPSTSRTTRTSPP
jgi:dTDP-4-amino-4,6-dideoxygalactose transaminase